MMKNILIGVGVIVVLVVGGVVYFASNIDSIIKAAIEEAGSRTTRTQVTLAEVKISIQDGSGSLKGFRMSNPEGFKTDSAMRFEEVSVTIDTGTITDDVIVIKEVLIAKPDITYELDGTNSNIATIQKNVDEFAKSMGAGGGGGNEASSSEGGRKVIIENLIVRGGTIAVSAGFLQGKRMSVPLPTIHLKDIGKEGGKSNGATAAEVAEKLLSAISASASTAVSSLGLDKLKDAAMGMTEGAKKMLEGGTGSVGKMLEGVTGGGGGDATKEVGDTIKGVGDSLKGIFGK
jgi:uncharacterized protein involved in outer membrane biogenesis